jgi:hypothetical protein
VRRGYASCLEDVEAVVGVELVRVLKGEETAVWRPGGAKTESGIETTVCDLPWRNIVGRKDVYLSVVTSYR